AVRVLRHLRRFPDRRGDRRRPAGQRTGIAQERAGVRADADPRGADRARVRSRVGFARLVARSRVGCMATSQRDADQPGPTIFVLFGATGDLAKRMVLPAFFTLAKQGLLPEKWLLIGNGRGDV